MTANALAVVDEKAKFHGRSCCRRASAMPTACAQAKRNVLSAWNQGCLIARWPQGYNSV